MTVNFVVSAITLTIAAERVVTLSIIFLTGIIFNTVIYDNPKVNLFTDQVTQLLFCCPKTLHIKLDLTQPSLSLTHTHTHTHCIYINTRCI